MQQKRRQIMQTAINFVKIYPLTTLLVIFIWVICVIPIPETPLSNVTFADKWTHLAMYFSLSMCVAHEYFRKHKKNRQGAVAVIHLALAGCYGGTRRDSPGYLY